MDEKKYEKELKALSKAITDALVNNNDIMRQLSELRDRKIIDPDTLLGLAFKINDLLEIYGVTLTEMPGELALKKNPVIKESKSAKKDEPLKELKTREVIDGHDLTDNETAFQQWVMERFDEKGWLKRSGIKW